jgi:hypothetical protein
MFPLCTVSHWGDLSSVALAKFPRARAPPSSLGGTHVSLCAYLPHIVVSDLPSYEHAKVASFAFARVMCVNRPSLTYVRLTTTAELSDQGHAQHVTLLKGDLTAFMLLLHMHDVCS